MYQWGSTGMITNKTKPKLKKYSDGRSFLIRIKPNIVTMGLHKNDDQNEKLKFYKKNLL